MMNRDPVSGLTQRRSLTNDEEAEVKIDTPIESKIEISFTQKEDQLQLVGETNVTRESDEERAEIELAIRRSLGEIDAARESDEERAEIEWAIKRSLEDQEEPIVEEKNNYLSDPEDSPSDSDGKF